MKLGNIHGRRLNPFPSLNGVLNWLKTGLHCFIALSDRRACIFRLITRKDKDYL